MRYIVIILFWLSIFTPCLTYANKNILNVYAWSGEIPKEIIEQFEHETHIKVNYAIFDNNEIMYTKLRTNPKGYDLVEPSMYYIQRMHQQKMLEPIDKTKLSNYHNIDPFFLHRPHDPQSIYSIPFVWGVTGIFYNTDYFNENEIRRWADLYHPKFKNSLMLLDDIRSAFSSILAMNGHSINDRDPKHLHDAYLKLRQLKPNIRLFNSDAVISLLIDEDASVGMAWNGDVVTAQQENPKLRFVYPEEGFEIWVDHFVMLKDAPHKNNAYTFLNFLLRPDIAKAISLDTNYSTTNLAAKNMMPDHIKNNPTLYPPLSVISRGEFPADIGGASSLLEKYWEWLKMGA